MKRLFFVYLSISTICVYGSIISLERNYTGQINSYFEVDGVVYSLSGMTDNGLVQKYDLHYPCPYFGGMGINRPEGMSSDALQIDTYFFNCYGIVECWADGSVEGHLEIKETSEYPIGTLLELQINYAIDEVGDLSGHYIERGMAILDENFNILWIVKNTTNGSIETDSLPISVGTQYLFFMWQDLGNQYMPIPVGGSSVIYSAVALDFFVIPEPCTLLLLSLGGLLIRKR